LQEVIRANIFFAYPRGGVYTDLTWVGGRYGNAGMRPERRLSGRNGSGRHQPPR
jgi:hypothetical protein